MYHATRLTREAAGAHDQGNALELNVACPVLLSPLSTYLANNNSPSEEEIIEVDSIKAGPVYELQATNALILDAQRTLDSLLERKKALQSSIDRCDSILSRVRRIPVELWRQIFTHCLPTPRNPTISYSEAPLLLTHVCSLWRDISLTTPQLWNRIYIPIFYNVKDPIWTVSPAHLDHPELSDFIADKMEYRCNMVHEWLSRAGSLSLSIYLSAQSGEPLQQVHRRLLDIVVHFLDRCQKLDLMLIMIGEPYDILMRVGAAQLPRLHELDIYSLRATIPDVAERSGLFTTPSLRKLSIGSITMREPSDAFLVPLNWRNLNTLIIGSSMPLGWIHQLLRHCPSLVNLNLSMGEGGSIANLEPIPLPDLRTLCIYQDCPRGDDLYSLLRIPGLRTLGCYEMSLRRIINSPSIHSLLPCITALQKLVVNPRVFKKRRELEECFTLVSSIKHLVLGNTIDNGPWTRCYPDINHLACLTTEHFSEFGIDAPRLLLPSLETLEAYGPPLTDKELLDFISKRLDPSVHLTSRLNSVHVTFSRVKQMDISRQVEYHAGGVGVERFTLELIYRKTDLLKGLSPSLGLPVIDDGTLWESW